MTVPVPVGGEAAECSPTGPVTESRATRLPPGFLQAVCSAAHPAASVAAATASAPLPAPPGTVRLPGHVFPPDAWHREHGRCNDSVMPTWPLSPNVSALCDLRGAPVLLTLGRDCLGVVDELSQQPHKPPGIIAGGTVSQGPEPIQLADLVGADSEPQRCAEPSGPVPPTGDSTLNEGPRGRREDSSMVTVTWGLSTDFLRQTRRLLLPRPARTVTSECAMY